MPGSAKAVPGAKRQPARREAARLYDVGPLYEALLALQHRGQDAAGIITEDAGRFCLHKDNGMVRDVFGPAQLTNLRGSIGIGHVRYPTAGSSSCAEAQPFYVNSPYGITLAHNGNLVDLPTLKRDLEREFRHLNTGSDSEVLLNLLAIELFSNLSSPSHEGTRSVSPSSGAGAAPAPDCVDAAGRKLESLSAFDGKGPTDAQVILAVNELLRRCSGGYACVSMIIGYGLLAFRDPHGIRPLVYGRRKMAASERAGGKQTEPLWQYMVASESGALNSLGYEVLGDVPAGHALLMQKNSSSQPSLHDCLPMSSPRPAFAPCLFEYVYFARPDSVLDGVSVYRTRLRMGDKLAKHIMKVMPDHGIDVVVPVPDTSRTSALECATTLGIHYREGFIKNRYVGRTFIMPQQGLRKKSVRQKLTPIQSELAGRNVLLVDDSIVRGTTSKEIIQMAREAGAKKVFMASAAPPVRFPNVYGIDMPTRTELIASHSAVSEIEVRVAEAISADRVFYQDLEDLRLSIAEEAEAVGVKLETFDSSCFDGKYVTAAAVGDDYLNALAESRNADRGSGQTAMHKLDHLEIPKRQRTR